MGKSYKEAQPLTLPSEVELEEVQAKVYVDKRTHRAFFSEEDARVRCSNATTCSMCGEKVHSHKTYCDACKQKIREQQRKFEFDKAGKWHYTFPVFVSENRLVWDEDEFAEYLNYYDIPPEEFGVFQTAAEVHAEDLISLGDIVDMIEDRMDYEDAECPAVLYSVVEEFIKKVNALQDPICWVSADNVKFDEEQIARMNNLIKEINNEY